MDTLVYKEISPSQPAGGNTWSPTEEGSLSALACLLQAHLTVDESVRGILEVLLKLSTEDSGAFFNWKGQKLPW